MRRDLRCGAVGLIAGILLTVPLTAQLPLRVLGTESDRILLVGGDSLAPADSLPAGESLPKFKRCGAPTPPLGNMRGTGTVTYTLNAGGSVDTSTVLAVEARGMSFPGVTSAAVRVLGQCRFKPAKIDGKPVSIKLAQIMKFDTHWARRRDLQVAPRIRQDDAAATTMSELGLGSDSTTIIYGAGSKDVDETARMLYCSVGDMHDPPRSMSATLRYIVGSDGAVDPTHVSVRVAYSSSPVPETEAFARTLMTHCRFAPARVLGRPVPTVVQQTVEVRRP